jgi:hypothetical protein
MEAAIVSGQPISEIRALSYYDLEVLLDVVKERHDGQG